MSQRKENAIGVDLGGTNIRIGKISPNGQILELVIDHVPKGRDQQLNFIKSSLQKISSDNVSCIGLGFPGRVAACSGKILTAGFLELQDLNLAEMITDWTNLPAFIDTDANMALFAELKIGAARDYNEVSLLTIGTGIGGAIASNGKIFYGGGSAGQLGHITVDMNGAICNCGRRGCIETTSSGTALRELLVEHGFDEGTRIQDLLIYVEKGNPKAKNLLMQWILPLRYAMDSISATLGSELILLGGGLGSVAYGILQKFTDFESHWFTYRVCPCSLGDNAGVIGAAFHGLALI